VATLQLLPASAVLFSPSRFCFLND
jgi:hypothetical protein